MQLSNTLSSSSDLSNTRLGKQGLKGYIIPLAGLSDGKHEYEITLDNALLQGIPDTLIDQCAGAVRVSLDKVQNVLQLSIEGDVTVQVCCDRTLQVYDEHLSFSHVLIVKRSKRAETLTDTCISISYSAMYIDLQPHIYDYVCLALPMQRLHPDCKNNTETCIYNTVSATTQVSIDARWSPLLALKQRKNGTS